MAPKKRSTPRGKAGTDEVRIRMYRQGLGDCFLLTFRSAQQKNVHVVIDCGVLQGSPQGSDRLKKAVEDIRRETDGEVDLLVATHEHADHLSGFNRAHDVWSTIAVKRTWLAWTENESDPVVDQLKRRQRARLQAALAGLTRIQAVAAGLAGETKAKLEAQSQCMRGILAFALDEDDDPNDLLNPTAAAKKPSGPARALRWLKEQAGSSLEYCHPKDPPRQLQGLQDVCVFVLGPPEGPFIRHSDPRKGEAYELFGGFLNADVCFGLAAASDPALFGIAQPSTSQPFDVFHQRPYEHVRGKRDVLAERFFASHYGFGEADADAWRRIDTDWLNLTEGLALALTGHINNTSLALAFELGSGGPVLLFPGDAQAGSWLSWADLEWEVRENGEVRTVKGIDLLKRTVFYKVGHHGSHNATMKDQGLELMVNPDLVAFIPVHQATARRQVPEWKMPWRPLWKRLRERASHRVILSDQDEAMRGQMDVPQHLSTDASFTRKWQAFQKAITWDKGESALWVEYTCRR